MSGDVFPKPVGQAVAMLAAVPRHQARTETAATLETAHARIDLAGYDSRQSDILHQFAFRLQVAFGRWRRSDCPP